MFKIFFNLGKTSVKSIISCLFYVGFIPMAYFAYSFGNFMYRTHLYNKVISVKNNVTIAESANNWVIGLVGGIISFVFYIILWKIICELLLLIFSYLEKRLTQE